MGGYEISSFHKNELLSQFKDCQFFIESYAEESLLEILKGKFQYAKKPLFLYRNIDFHKIPSPYIENILKINTKVRLETKRGCPFSCSFCAHQDLINKKYHQLSTNKVYNEIDLFKKNNVKKNKYNDYLAKKDSLSDILVQTREKELQDLQTRIQNFQTSAQQDLQKKEQELLQPIIEKAKNAIQKVAKEKGYSYVFDTSVGALLYWPENSDDILPLVKKELGLQ